MSRGRSILVSAEAWKQWPESLKYDRGKNPSKEEKEAFRTKFGNNNCSLD